MELRRTDGRVGLGLLGLRFRWWLAAVVVDLWGSPVEVVEAELAEAEPSDCVRGLPVAGGAKVVERAGAGSVRRLR